MAELVKDLVLVSLGMGIGVVLMCIAQVSKMADEKIRQKCRQQSNIKIKKAQLIKNQLRFFFFVYSASSENWLVYSSA